MAKFSPIQLSKLEDRKGYAFMCPGCKGVHSVQTNPEFKPCWTFNGDIDKPTVNPSIRVRSGKDGRNRVCHSFVTNGHIQFLNDCTHELVGQTVELPEWD